MSLELATLDVIARQEADFEVAFNTAQLSGMEALIASFL
jgi:hypothetical protein